jgi:hypothetical protein
MSMLRCHAANPCNSLYSVPASLESTVVRKVVVAVRHILRAWRFGFLAAKLRAWRADFATARPRAASSV